MKKIIIIFIFIIFNFSSLASNIKNEFEKIRNNDVKNSKVLKLKIIIFHRLFMNGKKDLIGKYYLDKVCWTP